MSTPTHIVLVLFDGLRPDLVTPERMPHLAAFVASGTQYIDSHCDVLLTKEGDIVGIITKADIIKVIK